MIFARARPVIRLREARQFYIILLANALTGSLDALELSFYNIYICITFISDNIPLSEQESAEDHLYET